MLYTLYLFCNNTRSPTTLGVRKLQSLGYHVVLFASSYWRVTHTHTDRQTQWHRHTMTAK